jgi:putative PIN family toxin of toxin-antitoxin system
MPRVPRNVPRIVLDTNVLVSALISPAGASARLLLELRAGSFELIVSPMLLAELREVLRREKFRGYVSENEVGSYVDLIESESVLVADPPPSSDPISPDPDDEFLIDLARSAAVDALVSGDSHLLELADSLPVLSPKAFLATLQPSEESDRA